MLVEIALDTNGLHNSVSRFSELLLSHDPHGVYPHGEARDDSVKSQLDRYNRWTSFVQPANPSRDVVRSTNDVQPAVHDFKATISNFLGQVELHVADLQRSVAIFARAVSEEGRWQDHGDLLRR